MRAWKAVVVLAGIGAGVRYAPEFVARWRGVEVMEAPVPVERSQSAGLFVGVRKFDYAVEVPYAVDDAVDLAYLFAVDPRVSVVPPSHVVLALSGTPQKPKSKEHLSELRSRGAKVEKADAATILNLLEKQADIAGKDGLLVVSLATHGFVENGIPKVLGTSSRFQYPETALSLPTLFDIASRSSRSLFFIDACRERITAARSAAPQPAAAAPLLEQMKRYVGQVLFYAAPAGGYAYDDDKAKNGVFTKAVVDGLKCNASARRDTVRVETLQTRVEQQVLDWIHQHRDPSIKSATQVSFDGNSRLMPLAQCPPPPTLISVTSQGAKVTGYDEHGRGIWSLSFPETVSKAVTADLDSDGRSEVVVSTPQTLFVHDHRGRQLWRKSAPMPLVGFDIGDRAKGTSQQQVVALWSNVKSSRMVSYDFEGEQLEQFEGEGALQHILIYRPTRQYAPKIVLSDMSSVMIIGKKPWRQVLKSSPRALGIADCDGDKKKDIVVTFSKGRQCFSIKGDLLTN